MDAWFLAGLALIGTAIVGWIAGEVRNIRPARILCVVVLILAALGTAIPVGLSGLFAASNTSLDIGRAVQDWAVAVRDGLSAGRGDSVRDELDVVVERLTPTYESGAFISELDASAARLRR